MDFSPFAALQRTDANLQTRWFHYSDPVEVLEARHLEEVIPTLEQAAEAQARGLHAVGWIAYEAAPAFDSHLETHTPFPEVPLVRFTVFRHQEMGLPMRDNSGFTLRDPTPSLDRERFMRSVEHIRSAIAAGETYQVNFTYPLQADFQGDPWSFFRQLRQAQAARHQAYLEEADQVVVSASPECFFRLENGRILSRPMKGTSPPGDEEALRTSVKNRAENIMIVDMIRNDLGKLARTGSVRANPLFEVERYPSVSQMTSTVSAEGSHGVLDWLRALFPCASITGAPKRNTMRWIRELETGPRGIYTGCVGGLFGDGVSEFNVAIRTAVIRKNTFRYHTGCGIVWDSDPSEEYEESRLKTRVLRHASPPVELIETMKATPSEGVALWSYHRARLLNSAAELGFELDAKALDREIGLLRASLKQESRIRLALTIQGHITLTITPLRSPTSQLTFAVDSQATAHNHPQLRHKTTQRDVYAAARERHPEAEETLLINERGELMEFCIGNVLFNLDGEWVTPPRSSGCLGGTARAEALEAGGVKERICTLADLDRAEEVCLINAVRGRVKMIQIAG